MDKTKSCENCKYYREHYFWYISKLIPAHSGHCIKRKNKPLVLCSNTCDKWEQDTDRKARQNENIKNVLIQTAKQINEINCLLKCGNEKAPR